MKENVTRRGFVAGSALTVGLVGLAGCSNSGTDTTVTSTTGVENTAEVPAADAYPIEPDGDDVEAKWSSEETRNGWTKVTNPDDGATIGVMDTANIIQVGGLAFRDMNGNGKLDLWEDWRQPVEDRAKALADSLSAEDIFPLLWAGGAQDGFTSTDTDAYDLIYQGSRAGVSRLEADGENYATCITWINNLQQICEESDQGIPYLNYSDPYNLFGVPSAVALASCMDKDIWRKAGMWQARAWRASGVRCDLGPQIDVYSNPIGSRLSGSVSEDPALNRDFAAAFGGGMQSTWGDDEATEDLGWGEDSCGVMLKHFVGEGCPEGGRNDHLPQGKWNVFPGSNFEAHLVPFLDGGMKLDSKTEQMVAVMPCYGIAYNPDDPDAYGEHVGSAYSKYNMSILRNAGWKGMICTDWTVLKYQCNGVADKTEAERFQIFMNNTISQHGGTFQPDVAKEAYELMVAADGEETALATIRGNAMRFFELMLKVQLFDQPYSETSVAKEIFENEDITAFGADVADKCVVMLKNSGNVISEGCMKDKPKVYIPQRFVAESAGSFGTTPASIELAFDEDVAKEYFDVVTDTVNSADPENPTEDDITRLTAADLEGVKYAVVKIQNPQDAYDGAQGGTTIASMIMGAEEEPGPYYKPITLQYRPFTADGDYIRKESLNPEDEFGVKEDRSYYGESTYATNEADLDLVLSVKEALPADAKLIVIVDADHPMVFGELEPSCDVIVMGFDGIGADSYARIITGAVEPSGLLAYQMPLDMKTVYVQEEDVPRDMDCYVDADGNTYDFCFGLNWSGVIDDDRVATYKVAPLTKVENFEVKADA